MLILITVLLMAATTLALLVLRAARPQFRFAWLIAVGATFLAWISVLIWRVGLPLSLSFGAWAPTDLLPSAAELAADQYSWLYALALVSLALATLLTETVREGFPDSATLAASIGVCALGVAAVTAGNPLTLAMIWAALDLAELVAMLGSSGGRLESRRVVTTFAVHGAATVLLMLAQVMSGAAGKPVTFATLSPRAGLLLLAAGGLRLGMLPMHMPFVLGAALRRGVATTIRLGSAAASLVLLSHVPTADISSFVLFLFALLTAAASLYASWMWLRAPDELAGRPYWIVGMSGLSLFAALRGNSAGAAAWGVALILAGGALFLSSVQHVWLNRLLFVGAWVVSSLPFSLTATGWSGAGELAALASPFLIASQSLLAAGFIRHTLRPSTRTSLDAQPAWTRSAYPAGIGLLLLLAVVLGVVGWDGAAQLGTLVPGILAALLAAVLVWAVPRLRILNPVPAHWLRPGGSGSRLDALYQLVGGLYRWLGGVSLTISGVLEGEAGLMWTLLFLVLFILMIMQRTP